MPDATPQAGCCDYCCTLFDVGQDVLMVDTHLGPMSFCDEKCSEGWEAAEPLPEEPVDASVVPLPQTHVQPALLDTE